MIRRLPMDFSTMSLASQLLAISQVRHDALQRLESELRDGMDSTPKDEPSPDAAPEGPAPAAPEPAARPRKQRKARKPDRNPPAGS